MSDKGSDVRAVQTQLLLVYAQRQMEAGKWLLASLLVVNGGALVAILTNDLLARVPSTSFAASFVIGIAAAFGAGAASWWLSNYSGLALRLLLDVPMFQDEPMKKKDAKMKGIAIPALTMWFFSIVSLGSFLIGCWLAIDAFSQITVS